MKLLLVPAVALAQSALAAAVLPRQETQEIQIVLQVDKVNNRAAIDVYNHDKSTLVAHSCSRTLSSGGLDIAFNVDNNGGGNFTVGSQTFNVNDDVETQSGIVTTICGRIITEQEAVLNCIVPNSLPLSALAIAKRDLKTCFPEGPLHVAEVLESFEVAAQDESIILTAAEAEAEAEARVAAEAAAALTDAAEESTHGKRCFDERTIVRVGNGDPHQNPWNIQVSVPIQCDPDRTCEVSYNQAKSFTIGFQASISAGGYADVGFAVQRTVETGTSHYCNGNNGDYLAIWKNVGTTAYSVQVKRSTNCQVLYEPYYVLWSPNKNDRFSSFYCVYGRQYVRNIGDRWLDIRDDMPYGP